MAIEHAPVRVSRVGGAVETFTTPRLLYKSVATPSNGGAIATLALPPNTRLVYPARPAHAWNSNKLRAERAYVVALNDGSNVAVGPHARHFRYEVGTLVTPESFDPDPTAQSGGGLHCFATRDGARHWGRREHARPME